MGTQTLCHEELALLSRMAPRQPADGADGEEGDSLPQPTICARQRILTPYMCDAVASGHSEWNRRVFFLVYCPCPPYCLILAEALQHVYLLCAEKC